MVGWVVMDDLDQRARGLSRQIASGAGGGDHLDACSSVEPAIGHQNMTSRFNSRNDWYHRFLVRQGSAAIVNYLPKDLTTESLQYTHFSRRLCAETGGRSIC